MQRQKLRSNPKKKFGHRNGRSSCAHSIGKFFLGYIVLFSFETSATGSPGNYLYILYCLDWIFLYRYVLTSSSPALNPCDFIPWITAQSLGTSVDPLSQIWPNNNHIKRQFTYVVLWCIHAQMLHETGIFTKPFPLECSHFSPHVSKQSIHEAFGIYDIWPNTPYTEIAYDMMWRNTLVLWYDWVVVSNIYIYRYIYILFMFTSIWKISNLTRYDCHPMELFVVYLVPLPKTWSSSDSCEVLSTLENAGQWPLSVEVLQVSVVQGEVGRYLGEV